MRADKIEKNIYFIKQGVARAYSDKNDVEITFWFGKEGDTIISMKSYIANQKGYENVELLEDCELYERHIASFLGITQVSLSRIRAEIK